MSSSNLTDFRNQYLAKAKTVLTTVDLANCSETDLILQSAMLRAYDAVNRFDAITPEAISLLESMSAAELESYLSDASNRQSFEQVVSSGEAMRAVVSSVGAMAAITNSAKAMSALAGSTTAWASVMANTAAYTVVLASATAMTAVAASSTAWAAVMNNSSAYALVLASATAMTAVAASPTAMAAVVASTSAMNLLLSSSVGRGAFWANSAALNALQNAPSVVLDALQSHPQVSSIATGSWISPPLVIPGKSMTLRVRNGTDIATFNLRTLAGGSGSGDDTFNTTTAWQTRVRAYNNLQHYGWSTNNQFQAYVVNMN